ncbi:MAG TPA: lamin tail domain-containing protein [Verrucomicrobiae bacterium]|nr:lamin tail domain-containing protein [Verrucomicrobiae bacterium]
MKKSIILVLVLIAGLNARATLPAPAVYDAGKSYDFSVGQAASLSGLSLYTEAGYVSPAVVIAEIYGGGGNSGAPYQNDYILIFNRGNSGVDINGWSVQYATSSSSTWNVTVLATNSTILPPSSYFLIQEASGGTNGAALPVSPDVVGSFNMAVAGGKLALVNNSSTLTGNSPTGNQIVDFVGWGTANFYHGSAPAAAPAGNVTSIQRNNGGCTDTDDNFYDFSVATPAPSQRSTLHNCNPNAFISASGAPYYAPTVASLPGEVVWNIPVSKLNGTTSNLFSLTLYTTNVSLVTTGSFNVRLDLWSTNLAEITNTIPFTAASTGQCFTTLFWTNSNPIPLNIGAAAFGVRTRGDINAFVGITGASMKSY